MTEPTRITRIARAIARAETAEQRLSETSRALGEAEGKLAASEIAGIVEGWKARAERAEAEAEKLRAEVQRLENPIKPSGVAYWQWEAHRRAALNQGGDDADQQSR